MKDEEIIALLFRREEDALEAIHVSYGRFLHSIAAGIAGSETAEECVNDALLKAWNAIPPERPRYLRAYLGRIVRNLALNRREMDTAAKRGGGTASASLEELAECIPAGLDPAKAVETAELSRALNRFLRSLPERQCNLFLARYWNALPLQEIGARFGMGQGAVKSALRRIRVKLRHFLEQEEWI